LHGTGANSVVELAQPVAHLSGGALGKGHPQHLPGRDMTGGDQVRDAACDGAGLTGAGAGQYAQRTARCEHRFTLLVVEAVGDAPVEAAGDGHGAHHGRGYRQFRCGNRRRARVG